MDSTAAASMNMLGAIGSAAINAGEKRESQHRAYKYQKWLNEQLNDFQKQLWQMQWDATNAYNLPTAQIQRLMDAGINPALDFNNGSTPNPAAVPSASSASAPSPGPSIGADFGNIGSAFMANKKVASDIAVNDSIVAKNEADARAAEADAGLNESRRTGVDIANDVNNASKDVLINSRRLSYLQDQLDYSLGLNRLSRDNLDTSLYGVTKSLDIAQKRLDVDNAAVAYDRTLTEIDLMEERKALTRAEANLVRQRARVSAVDAYFAEFRRNAHIEADSDRELFDSLVDEMYNEAMSSLVESSTEVSEANLAQSYLNQYGDRLNELKFKRERAEMNDIRFRKWTSLVGSLSGVAGAVISRGGTVEAARIRSAAMRANRATARRFSLDGSNQRLKYHSFDYDDENFPIF